MPPFLWENSEPPLFKKISKAHPPPPTYKGREVLTIKEYVHVKQQSRLPTSENGEQFHAKFNPQAPSGC